MIGARHITVPKGFRAAGVKCGIKPSGKEDLAIFAADDDASAAIMTTQNQFVGAPVVWCRKILPAGYGKARAMVINSGVANVANGKRGLKDAETMARETAGCLGCEPQKVLVASTGVIGHHLPMAKIRRGIAAAAKRLGTRNDGEALRAIMTTDTREKSALVQGRIGGKLVTISGIVKGAGMIAPSMATMLCVITTDAAVRPAALHKVLRSGVDRTLNAVTVDSDTSTSDTVAIFASGAAGNVPLATRSKEIGKFASALHEVLAQLARAMAADGEGATKLIEVHVRGARSDAEARTASMSVANSPLLKCAVHGCDPNWGRIVMALGKSAAKIDPEKLKVKIGETTVFSLGRPRSFDAKKLSRYLGQKEVSITCNLNLGEGEYTALTCDLSREYVAINADYHT